MLDWTITLGNMIEIVGILGGGIFFMAKVSGTFKLLVYRLEHLEATIAAHSGRLNSINDAMVTLARQEERLNNLSARIESMRQDERS